MPLGIVSYCSACFLLNSPRGKGPLRTLEAKRAMRRSLGFESQAGVRCLAHARRHAPCYTHCHSQKHTPPRRVPAHRALPQRCLGAASARAALEEPRDDGYCPLPRRDRVARDGVLVEVEQGHTQALGQRQQRGEAVPSGGTPRRPGPPSVGPSVHLRRRRRQPALSSSPPAADRRPQQLLVYAVGAAHAAVNCSRWRVGGGQWRR